MKNSGGGGGGVNNWIYARIGEFSKKRTRSEGSLLNQVGRWCLSAVESVQERAVNTPGQFACTPDRHSTGVRCSHSEGGHLHATHANVNNSNAVFKFLMFSLLFPVRPCANFSNLRMFHMQN